MKMRIGVAAVVAAMVGGTLALMVAPAQAGTAPIVVTTTEDVVDGLDGLLSLREAFALATTDGTTSVIVLGTTAHYQLDLCADPSGQEDANADGDLDVTTPHLFVLQGNGSTIQQTCAGERVVDINDAGSSTLSEVTLTGGTLAGVGQLGGGINGEGPLTLLGVTVAGNEAPSGGGVATQAGLTMQDTVVRNNEAGSTTSGGVHNQGGQLTMVRSVVDGNTAATNAGGISTTGGSVSISRSAIVRNEATTGFSGGIASFGALSMTESTVAGNEAATITGGVQAAVSFDVSRSTIARNRAPAAANINVNDLTSTATVYAEPQGGGDSCAVAGATPVSGGHNVDDTGTSCGLGDTTDVQDVGFGYAQLGELYVNGGQTLTLHPEQSSPLINKLPSSDPACTGADQRNVARPQGSDCDVGAVEVPGCNGGFVDVDPSHPFCYEIGWMSVADITTGFPGDAYRPSAVVTRQAMSAFMYRLALSPTFPEPGSATFSDVPPSHPFFTEVEWMNLAGVTTGFPDGTYRPAEPVTRQAMSAFMYRLAGSPAFVDPVTATFGDVANGHPFFTEVEWMNAEGITTGFPGSPPTYRPAEPVTRQAMSAFMYRLAQQGLVADFG